MKWMGQLGSVCRGRGWNFEEFQYLRVDVENVEGVGRGTKGIEKGR